MPTSFNEWIDPQSLILTMHACSRLNYDCRLKICSWLPLNIWSRCTMCGIPLIHADDHGRTSISKETEYAYDICRTCFWREL